MTFSIGSSSVGMGPRSALEDFGSEGKGGEVYNPKVVNRMLAYLKPYRGKMIIALILTLLESALTLMSPYLIKVAIDQYILPKDIDGLARISLILVGVFIGTFLVSSAQRYLISWIGLKALAQFRSDLFNHLQRIHLGYHDKHITGVTVSRVINDVAEINELLSQGVITLIGDLILLLGIIGIMLQMSPQLAIFTFSVLPLMIGATWLFSRHAKDAFRETRSKVAAVVGDLAEDINGIRAIQAFTREEASFERFEETNRANRDAYISAMTLSYIFLPAMEFLGMLATLIVLWAGGSMVISDQVTLGVLVAFLSYVTRFFQPIQELSRMYTTFQSAMAGGEQVIRMLDTPIEVADAPNAIELTDVRGAIAFENVSFKYLPETDYVLKNISFSIQPGETIAIVGPTGAGKTTISSLIARYYEIQEGTIRIDGIDIRDVKQQSLRRQVRTIAQDPFLFSRTIRENIAYGDPGASFERIIQAARDANADGFIRDLPDGYETRIQEGGVNVSQGQRQLLSIARALLTDPKILILDEATANIDTLTELLIQQALERLLADRTAVVIAHRLSTVRKADKILVLDKGAIIQTGTHDQLIRQPGLYQSLYERQFMD